MSSHSPEQPPSAAIVDNFADRFLLALHRELSVDHVAWTTVNDLRCRIGADRVSFISGTGRQMRIRAISGLESVQKKSPVCRKMLDLAKAVVRMREPLFFQGELAKLAESVERALTEYLSTSNAIVASVVPLYAPLPATLDDSPEAKDPPQKIIGCLVCEQFTITATTLRHREFIDQFSGHIAAALSSAQIHESVLFQPILKQLGLALTWLKGRRLAWAIFLAITTVVTITAMTVIRIPYRFRVDGHLMPGTRSSVFAPWESDVVDLLVKDGQFVTKGQPLVVLVSDVFQTELVILKNKIREKDKLVASLRTRLHEANSLGSRKDAIMAEGEFVREQIELQGAELQLERLQQRIDALTVRAPHEGVIVTFDLKKRLAGRPVNRGDLLLEIMDMASPWRLELEVPDYRMGHLMNEIRQSPDHSALLTFVLANDVERTWNGAIQEIATRTNVSEKSSAYVDAYASIDPTIKAELRLGAEANARITCGHCSLLYSLLGDAYEFVLRKWF